MKRMCLRLFVLSSVVSGLALGGCARQATSGEAAAEPGATTARASTPASGVPTAPGEDGHWIQPDDFFIADVPHESGYIAVRLAKMKKAPDPGTKNEGQFFDLNEAADVWTANYWKTRIAQQEDLVVGNLAICFEGNAKGDVFSAPGDKQSARTGAWFMGRITDTSDLFKNQVSVDTYICSPAAVRVPAT